MILPSVFPNYNRIGIEQEFYFTPSHASLKLGRFIGAFATRIINNYICFNKLRISIKLQTPLVIKIFIINAFLLVKKFLSKVDIIILILLYGK